MTNPAKITVSMILGVVVLLAGAFFWPHLRYLSYSNAVPRIREPKPAVIGHRGAKGLAPENTISGLRMGIGYADVLEIDVHLSKDGSVVVMHDESVDRTTNGNGKIIDLTMESIRGLDAGVKFGPEFRGEAVPTLDDVLRVVGGQRTVLVELKWPSKGIYDQLVPKVIEIIRAAGAEYWVQLQSFEPAYLEEVMRTAPDIKCNQLLYGFLSFPPVYQDRYFHFGRPVVPAGINSVVIYYKYLSPGFVREMHARRIGVAAYTVNELSDIDKVLNLGVDAIISDYPDRVYLVLNYTP